MEWAMDILEGEMFYAINREMEKEILKIAAWIYKIARNNKDKGQATWHINGMIGKWSEQIAVLPVSCINVDAKKPRDLTSRRGFLFSPSASHR